MRALRLALTVAAFVGGGPASAQEAVRLLCDYKSPVVEAEKSQQHVLEVDAPKKWIYSQQFVDGKPLGRLIPYEIATNTETMLIGIRKDDAGRITDELTMNRLTAEASFAFYVYGNKRDQIWDNEKQRMGGFEQDPVKMKGNVMRCRPAVKQF